MRVLLTQHGRCIDIELKDITALTEIIAQNPTVEFTFNPEEINGQGWSNTLRHSGVLGLDLYFKGPMAVPPTRGYEKIRAIKRIRELTGVRLTEAKGISETLYTSGYSIGVAGSTKVARDEVNQFAEWGYVVEAR